MSTHRKKLRRRSAPAHNRSASLIGSPNARRLHVESLEERRMLAVLTVENDLDDTLANLAGDGQLSLREAIEVANNPGTVIDGVSSNDIADTIDFASALSGSTINLSDGELLVIQEVTIDAKILEKNVTLDASGSDPTPNDNNGDGSRIFRIDDESGTKSNVTISGLTLTGGDVSSAGGAIFSLEHLTLVQSHITGNSVSSTSGFLRAGGGIYINDANLDVEASTISNNHVYHDDIAIGGGISSGSGDVTISSSTISGNRVITQLGINGGTSYGGGLALGAGTHLIAHSTLADNRATGMDAFGGGVFAFGTAHATTLDHTIVGNNIAEFGSDISASSPITVRHSLIEDTSGVTIVGVGNVTGLDPLLGPLQNNGGSTPTHALVAGSPAIVAGDFGFTGPPDFDQRGEPFDRVTSGRIDIGAYELQTEPSADFDGDGDIDGRDFLTWQRGFGIAKPNATKSDGDADNDTDVDGVDLSVWAFQFGTPAPLSIISTATTAFNSFEFEATTTTAARLSVDLVDAAMAMAWLGIADDQVDPLMAQEPLVESAYALTDPFDDLPFERNIAAEDYLSVSTERDTETSEERWLTDDLLDLVFS